MESGTWFNVADVAADHEGWEAERAEIRARLHDITASLGGGDHLWWEVPEASGETTIYHFQTLSERISSAFRGEEPASPAADLAAFAEVPTASKLSAPSG
jgi:hypothetical protein